MTRELGTRGAPLWRRSFTQGALALAFASSGVAASGEDLKPSPPTVVDLADSKGTVVQTTSEEFRQRIVVQLDAVKPKAVLKIEGASLLGPDGVVADLSITALSRSGASIEVVPAATGTGAVIDITLSGTLPRLGEYAGYITLRYGDDKPVVRSLRVTRTMVDLPIETLGTERVASRYCLTRWRVASVLLTLQAPPDRALTVTPTLAQLALNRTGKESVQATVGNQTIAVGDVAVDAGSGITMKAGETKRVAVDISGFAETGEYAGKVRFTAAGFKAKDQAFTVLVKDAWWLAVIPIVLGAAASMWVRRYGSDQRPRLIVRQRIAQLTQQIDALHDGSGQLDDAERRVLDAFARRLTVLQGDATGLDRLPDTWNADARSTLQRLAMKLQSFTLWSNARRLVRSLDPSIDTKAIDTRLLALQTALEGDADLSDAQKAELSAMPAETMKLRRDAMLGGFDALQRDLDSLRAIVLPAQLLASAWAQAKTGLDQARDHARRDDFDVARGAYEGARKAFADLLLADLSDRVAAGTPVGFETQQWTDLKPQIEQLLAGARTAADARAALEGYAQAYGAYLQAHIGVLLPKLQDSAAMTARVQKLQPDKQQPVRDQAESTAAKLRNAAAALTSGDLKAAYANHLEAVAAWQTLNDLLPAGSKMGGPGGGAPGTVPIAPVGAMPPGAGSLPTLVTSIVARAPENAAELSGRTKRMDRMVDLLAIVLAAVLGVQFVWGPNPTWGGLSDWLFALLWGLGLHQVTGFTFDGVLGLREKLLK